MSDRETSDIELGLEQLDEFSFSRVGTGVPDSFSRHVTRGDSDTNLERLVSAPSPEPTDVAAALGAPLDFLPKDISPDELQAYRLDYQAFRAGNAAGAKGEIGSLCPSAEELTAPWGAIERQSYVNLSKGRCARRRTAFQLAPRRFVPLIGLNLQTTSAAESALDAARLHRERSFVASDDVHTATPQFSSSIGGMKSMPASPTGVTFASPLQVGSTAAPGQAETGNDDAASSNGAAPDTALLPWQRGPNSAVFSQPGVGFLLHVLGSLACLVPCLIMPSNLAWWRRLRLPATYIILVLAHIVHTRVTEDRSVERSLAQALRMERLIRDGCVPAWFPALCTLVYALLALQLALARAFGTPMGERRIALWSATPERHDYSCWGNDDEDVADCVLVRHAAFTGLVSFYTCLLALHMCNRNVKGVQLVSLHRENLLELFPVEAPPLFAYVERSVDANLAYWRTSRRYGMAAVALSCAWTVTSFGVYVGLLDRAKSLARAVFITAVPCTYFLFYVLLQHVLLRVLLHLEAVKARAAALAYCDEEGVLPFTSAHAIYVWYSVRRNVQAQNEVAYQHTTPFLAVSLICATASSCLVATQLFRRGLSVFALTSRGGVSVMVVASALLSCVVVGVFLSTLLAIGKLEEAHARQLRIAHLRLEHTRCQQAAAHFGRSGRHHAATRSHSGVPPVPPSLLEVDEGEEKDEEDDEHMPEDIEGALSMVERVVTLLEQHDPRPTIFGVEIGAKSFQVVYAALLSNGWYVMVWGVIIPLLCSDDEKS